MVAPTEIRGECLFYLEACHNHAGEAFTAFFRLCFLLPAIFFQFFSQGSMKLYALAFAEPEQGTLQFPVKKEGR